MDVEDMDEVLALYRDLFRINETTIHTDLDRRIITGDEAEMRLAEGFTLIEMIDLLPEMNQLTAAVGEVVRALARHLEDPAALNLETAGLMDYPSRLKGLARTYLNEGEENLRNGFLTVEGKNPEVTVFVLFNALKSTFLGAAAQCSHLDTSVWEQGYCPVCGGEPAAAYMLGEGGRRYLICYRCETHWRYRRFACPYCSFQDPKQSGYLFSDESGYRSMSASVCSDCQAYIKGWRIEGDYLGRIHPEVEDLKTPGFDRAVNKEGYSRGAPNIFGVWLGSPADEDQNSDQDTR
jgi:hypothetical protein